MESEPRELTSGAERCPKPVGSETRICRLCWTRVDVAHRCEKEPKAIEEIRKRMACPDAEEFEALRALCQIPKRGCLGVLENLCETDYNSHGIQAAEWMRDRFIGGTRTRGVYLWGPTGTGKTCIASTLAFTLAYQVRPWFHHREPAVVVRNGSPVSVWWWSVPELMDALYQSLRDDEAIDQSRLKTVDVLCLDDLGKTAPTEWALKKLFAVVSARWDEEKPCIITSNYAPEQLGEEICRQLGKAAVKDALPLLDRIRETCDVMELRGQSWRGDRSIPKTLGSPHPGNGSR